MSAERAVLDGTTRDRLMALGCRQVRDEAGARQGQGIELWPSAEPEQVQPALELLFSALPRLRQLTITWGGLAVPAACGAALLRGLRGRDRLEALEIRCLGLRDEGWEPLAGLVALQRLRLDECKTLGDGAMGTVAALPRRSELSLTNTAVTDDGLAALAEAPALARLDLSMLGEISAHGLARLRSTALERLVLRGMFQLGDDAAAALTRIQTLRDLTWPCHELPPDNAERFGALSPAGAAGLATLPRLAHLDLSGHPLGATGFKRLAAAPALSHLVARHCGVDASAASALARLPLRSLSLAEATAGHGVLAALAARGSSLRSLRLAWFEQLPDPHALERLVHLRIFDADTAVDDAALRAMSSPPLPMETLRLHRAGRVTDDGVRLLTRCASLRELWLGEASEVSASAMEDLGRALPGCEVRRW